MESKYEKINSQLDQIKKSIINEKEVNDLFNLLSHISKESGFNDVNYKGFRLLLKYKNYDELITSLNDTILDLEKNIDVLKDRIVTHEDEEILNIKVKEREIVSKIKNYFQQKTNQY